MDRIRLGPDAPHVSVLGFGAMHLSIAGRPPESEACRVLHAVLDAGVSLIDTADVYCLDDADMGHNERLIARVLRERGQRDEVLVATKGGLRRPGGRWERDGRPERLRAACEGSLRALGVEQIALYQLHAPDPAVPFAESVGAMAALRDEGKIRWVGLSNVSVRQIEAARAIVPIQTVQNRLHLFDRQALRRRWFRPSVVAYCARHGLGFLAYSPLGGRRLSRTLGRHPVLCAAAERYGCAPHAVALAWVRAQGSTVIPIPGSRRVEHALESVGAWGLRLEANDVAAISRAARRAPRW